MKGSSSLVESCEADVRAGRADLVARRLSGVNLAKLPRQLRLPLANICRRTSLLNLGLKILSPVVRYSPVSTAQEKAEYAVLLQRSGAVREALQLLKSVDPRAVPESLLFSSFCHFNRWEYELAVPLIKKYLEMELKPYARLVGQVNLAAALIVNREVEEAFGLLEDNLRRATELEASRLRGNCLELMAQVCIHQKNWPAAEGHLTQAKNFLGAEESLDHLFVDKWRAVVESLRSRTTTALDQFKLKAQRFGDAESVREADLFSLQLVTDETKFNHLYFGTPYAGYRRRMETQLARRPSSDTFDYGSPTASQTLILQTGEMIGTGKIKPGKKNHQVLAALLRDLYQPMTIGMLFAELFPDENFDAYSSPGRIHQSLRRARAWLEEEQIAANIVEHKGCYSVEVGKDFCFRLELSSECVNPGTALRAQLRSVKGDSIWFSAAEAARLIGISLPTVRRLIKSSLAGGQLEKSGTGRATIYRLKSSLSESNLSVSGSIISKAS